mmetsp:Transcript_22841/g.29598  ORF Transcript_22841/g.29598 Transcript_22841/m.29598 type:complete len:192 (-) Transcript_22841:31-606(-)
MSTVSKVDIETENRAVLVVLSQADEYYKEQQRLAKALRKGFLDLAKARMNTQGRISALDCREEIWPEFTVDFEHLNSNVDTYEASMPWRPHVSDVSASIISSSDNSGLQRRSGGRPDDNFSNVILAEEVQFAGTEHDFNQKNNDTILLFTGLAPPALRKAKKEFVQALSYVIKIANATQKINAAKAKILPA